MNDQVLTLGAWTLDPIRRVLAQGPHTADLGDRAFDLLWTLAQSPGEVISAANLFARVWPGRVVEENNLHVHISALRKVLGPQAIRTVRGRGYQITLVVAAMDARSPLAARKTPDENVPGSPAPSATQRPRQLLGRDQEFADVLHSVRTNAVTTLVGPGGVGKTALASGVAAAAAAPGSAASAVAFADGVVTVWLAPLRAAELVAAEVAVALGLTRSGGLDHVEALTRWLVDKDLLLMLDNCEHVVDAVADLVDALTARLPRLRVLATSREPLWVDGEVSYRLEPLALPLAGAQASLDEIEASPAVQLFRARVGARHSEMLKTEHGGRLTAEICRRVDGLPLAIELAAARAVGLGLEDIRLHLDDLFELLPRPVRRVDGGQRSLRDTVEWSYALLSVQERSLLHRMAVFAGGFNLVAINAICAEPQQSPAQTAALTARLVEKSLLMKLGESGRYHLLETIRQYAQEKLAGAGEQDAMRDRHAHFYCGVARPACAGLTGGPERPHIDAIAEIEDNLRVALARLVQTAPETALELTVGLTNFWWMQGKLHEGTGWMEQALAAASNAPPELRAAGLFCMGFLVAHDTDDWQAASRWLDEGIELLSGQAEPPLILGMLYCLRGECDVFSGDAPSAVARTQTGLAIAARFPGSWGLGFCLWNAAFAKQALGELDAALSHLKQMIALCVKGRYGIAEMVGSNTMAEILEAREELEASRALWERAYQLRRDLGASRMGYVHGSLPGSMLAVARVATKQGDFATASPLLTEALPLAQAMRDGALTSQIEELIRSLAAGGATARQI
jgi:predicted ATPase/DNA-binding winged helix-turn-helix (wHTH) protein